MLIHQFYDKGLAHGSYAIVSEGQMAVIDPTRNPAQYIDFAKQHACKILAIIQTHPHADFVSGFLELSHLTSANIYVSNLYGAEFTHVGVMHLDEIKLGKSVLRILFTPGHSPDSISVLAIDEDGKENSVFTGDTLFIGDVGRPDLRENVGNLKATKEKLAIDMYSSTRRILMLLPSATEVYPAHGAGSLCGKSLSADLRSTIGREVATNYALQNMDEASFVKTLLADQPFMPKYFGYNVGLNKKGAPDYKSSIDAVPILPEGSELPSNAMIVDVRDELSFKKGHIKGAFNIQEGGKFETWLGSIISPDEEFYLVGSSISQLEVALDKCAKIGYEALVIGMVVNAKGTIVYDDKISADELKNKEDYVLVDLRNYGEYNDRVIFPNAIHIPLPELRERLSEIPTGKPIVVHCAAGYRSAAGQSIIKKSHPDWEVLDLSDDVKLF